MRGVAYTVFQGVKPESMDVEVLGIMRNVNGPKGDVILVRLVGTKPEYTGVVAGMSGSPVYFDGKLAGALAFRIGEFSKEPIAGVTPIAEMLEIDSLDRKPTVEQTTVGSPDSGATPDFIARRPSEFAPGIRKLLEADRHSACVQWIFGRNAAPFRSSVRRRRDRSGHGYRVGL